MRPELFGKPLQQLGMRGRIGGAEIVHRVHDAAPEEVAPNSVDRSFGEVGCRTIQSASAFRGFSRAEAVITVPSSSVGFNSAFVRGWYILMLPFTSAFPIGSSSG